MRAWTMLVVLACLLAAGCREKPEPQAEGVAKPEPAAYRIILERTGVRPEEALFIDDDPENVEAARSVGMAGILFLTVPKLRKELIFYKITV